MRMRVAALYDIHANLPALEAAIADVRRSGADQIIVGGDVVPGPMPRETIEYLLTLDLPVRFIQGNGDRDVLGRMRGIEPPSIPVQFREVIAWNAEQLQPDYESLIAGWPQTVRVEVAGLGDVLFCHATPRSDSEIFTRLTPQERLLPIFGRLNVVVAVCGHTHMQFDRMVGSTRVVNAGSVGMPFGDPGAYWLTVGPDVQLRRTEYDLPRAAARVRRTAYPQAEEFAARSIMRPPSEAGILEGFARVELR
jgi:predicted phosphodiesterase